MNIKVLFFGQLKDITGLREDRLELGDGAHVETVFEHYAGRFPGLRELSRSIVLAQNQQFEAAPPRFGVWQADHGGLTVGEAGQVA